jgi:aromatic ring-opening dioxygenase LigB subunit
MPHPPIILSGIGKGREHEALATVNACYRVAGRIAELQPEIIVVISPHAPLFSDFLFMYDRPVLGGSFARFGEPNLRFSFSGEHGFVEEFRQRLLAEGVTGGVPSGDVIATHDIDMDLDHGVLVPLSFVSAEYRDFGLVAISSSAFETSKALAIGRILAGVAKSSGRRACLIASGDMSHRVNAQSPYGMVRAGSEFDSVIAESIEKSEPERILSIDPDLRERAAECGYDSLVMLCGALGVDRNAVSANAGGRVRAGSTLYSYEAPFGIGYCVAEFSPGYDKEQ